MAPVKSKVVDTSATTPAAFLSGTSAPEATPADGTPLPTPTPTAPEQPPLATPTGPAPEIETPVRPGLETPAIPALAPTPDPFVLLKEWSTTTTKRTLRAFEIQGVGCIVRVSAAIPGNLSESICFVPDVRIEGNRLVGDASV